jgi:hypothetical protein
MGQQQQEEEEEDVMDVYAILAPQRDCFIHVNCSRYSLLLYQDYCSH